MNIDIKSKKENILLSRIELSGEITFDRSSTPSNEDVKKALSENLGIDEGLIVIKKISTNNGVPGAKFAAFHYLSKEELEKIEPRLKKKEEAKKEDQKDKAKAK